MEVIQESFRGYGNVMGEGGNQNNDRFHSVSEGRQRLPIEANKMQTIHDHIIVEFKGFKVDFGDQILTEC